VLYPGPDLSIGCVGLSLRPRDPTGFQQTVVRIESIAGVWIARWMFVKCLCLNYLWIGQMFATFFTASNSFLNTQNICSSMFWAVFKNFLLRIFAIFSIFTCNVYCNFYHVLGKMYKCNKTILQNYFSLVLFSLIAWKRAISRISCVSMLSMTKQLVCKLDVLPPQQSTNSIWGGKSWLLAAQTKHRLCQVFRSQTCAWMQLTAHKCNFRWK